jgi:membrane-associated phospholipid phosphatase
MKRSIGSDDTSFSERPALNRREFLRLLALSSLGLALARESGASPPQAEGRGSGSGPAPVEGNAGHWKTWLVASPRDLLPPPPPPGNSPGTRAEIQELLQLQSQRSDAVRTLVQFWDAQGGLPVWSQLLLNKIQQASTNPVLASRALALFHVAIADAVISAWYAKFAYHRHQPTTFERLLTSLVEVDHRLPSYPSEHAAVAAAAATVLGFLYPGGMVQVHGQTMTYADAADEAAFSRLWAGANYRSDMLAGLQIGSAVGQLAVLRGQTDGSDAVWDPIQQPGRLFGPQYWVPTPPAFTFPPLLPLAGTWRQWLLASGSQFRAPAPPALQSPFPSTLSLQEANEVKQTVDNLTPEQLAIAQFWADGAGTVTPPGHWAQFAAQQVAEANLSTPRAARAMALVGVGVADSAIACWDNKYAYWTVRPVTAIRTMVGQPFYNPNFITPITTPPFPSYTSGHSTFSGCSADVLEYLFPGGTVEDALGQSIPFRDAASQAALSPLYGGIHYRSDNDAGLNCGLNIAGLVIQRAQSDGA